MTAEMPRTQSHGERPPFQRPPKTGFSPDPDDQDRDMYVYLRENVKMLVSAIQDATSDQVRRFVDLIEQRKIWINEEMAVEEILSAKPKPPLGIENDPYDLGELADVQRDFRREKFEELLKILDQAQFRLEERFWEHLWSAKPSS